MQNIYAVFGSNSARLYEINPRTRNGTWDAKLSIMAFDIQAAALMNRPPVKVQHAAEQIRELFLFTMLTDTTMQDAISKLWSHDFSISNSAKNYGRTRIAASSVRTQFIRSMTAPSITLCHTAKAVRPYRKTASSHIGVATQARMRRCQRITLLPGRSYRFEHVQV